MKSSRFIPACRQSTLMISKWTYHVGILCAFSLVLILFIASTSLKLPSFSEPHPVIITESGRMAQFRRHSLAKGARRSSNSMAQWKLRQRPNDHVINNLVAETDQDHQYRSHNSGDQSYGRLIKPASNDLYTREDVINPQGAAADTYSKSEHYNQYLSNMADDTSPITDMPSNGHHGINKPVISEITRLSTTELPADSKVCDGKRIYMYDLPAEFNANIVKDCEYKIVDWLKFCPHVQNDGFGSSLNDSGWPEWFATDPYMLEVIFYHRMHHYPCRTQNPLRADAFFIPFYSGLDALYFLYGRNMSDRASQGLRLISWLEENAQETWKRYGGHDHFIVMGRTAWDFARPLNQNVGWGTSFRVLKEMERVTSLFLEKRPWEQNDQAIPYPTAFHPTSIQSLKQWQTKVRASPRPYLFAFVGAPRPGKLGSIRQSVLDQCLNAKSSSASMAASITSQLATVSASLSSEVPSIGASSRPSLGSFAASKPSSQGCTIVDCQRIKCAHNPKSIAEELLLSQFCLQPPGDTSTRRSTFDGMLSGCIPVFFHNDSAYTQYQWHLPADPSKYSVFISEKHLGHVEKVLRGYSDQKIQEMRETIVELIPNFIYMSSKAVPELMATRGSLGIKDAFDLSVERMLDRAAAAKRLRSRQLR